MSPLQFDATITLFTDHLGGRRSTGVPRAALSEVVGRAVRAVPGANWVDVEDAGGPLPESLRHRSAVDRLYAAGCSAVQDGPEWDALRKRIELVIARALAGEEPDETAPPTVHAAPAGLRRWFHRQREA